MWGVPYIDEGFGFPFSIFTVHLTGMVGGCKGCISGLTFYFLSFFFSLFSSLIARRGGIYVVNTLANLIAMAAGCQSEVSDTCACGWPS